MDAARVALIVDDDPSVLETMRALLDGQGRFLVHGALGVRAAMRSLQAMERLDLLVVDVDVSGGDFSVAFCHEAADRYPLLALVAISSDGPCAEALPASTVLLRKPFGARELLAAIQRADRQAKSCDESVGID
jgi:DNA-binding response OmpR family regulator